MQKSESILENNPPQILWDFELQMIHLITARRPNLVIIKKEKENLPNSGDFTVLADHRIKLKEGEKSDKYPELARELKKLWNMKVTVIPFVIGGLGTVTISSVQGLEGLER